MCDRAAFVKELERTGGWTVPEVLETMFFTAAAPSAEMQCREGYIEVRLDFRGLPSGTFRMALDCSLARELSSSFLGLPGDGLGIAEDRQVACELANIICGSILSRAESDTGFELGSPSISGQRGLDGAAWTASFAAEPGGAIEVAIRLDEEVR